MILWVVIFRILQSFHSYSKFYRLITVPKHYKLICHYIFTSWSHYVRTMKKSLLFCHRFDILFFYDCCNRIFFFCNNIVAIVPFINPIFSKYGEMICIRLSLYSFIVVFMVVLLNVIHSTLLNRLLNWCSVF